MDVRVLLLAVILSFNIEVNWSDDKCGHPIGVITTGKIIGGFDVGYFKYPWFVSLVRQDTPYCGGTLITSRHVVTAAHCFKSFIKQKRPDESNLQDVFGIQLGVYNICTSEATQKSFKAKTVDVHDRYLKEQPYFDIALLTLSEDAVGFEPCCLPKRELNSETRPKEGLIQGLGDQKYEATTPTCTVHEARVLIHKDDKCRDMLNSVENNGSALIHAFCAGYLQGGIDACQGDSGGPLIILGANSQYTLQGITSFGFECAAPKVLGLYTDVSHYLKWLHDKTKGQLNPPQMSTEVGTTIDTTESSPEVSYDDNITETLTEATEFSTESTTQASDSTTTSIDWSIYPVTTLDPATATLVPDQTTPPDNKKEKKEQKLTVIIININRNKHKRVSHLDNGHPNHGRNVRPKRKHIHKKEKKEKGKRLHR